MLKETTYRSARLRQSARDRACVCCGKQDGTTVWCHLNDLEFGHGMGLKGSDLMGFWGCQYCHDVYDGRRAHLDRKEKRDMGVWAFARTMYRLGQEGFFD